MKAVAFLSILGLLCLIKQDELASEAFMTDYSGLVSTKRGGSHQGRGIFRNISPRANPLHRKRTSLSVSFIEQSLKQISDTLDAEIDDPSFVKKLKGVVPQVSEQELGLLVLLTVPMAWGTYACTVQSIYALEPHVPGFLFSTCYFFVAALGSLTATFVSKSQQNSSIATSRTRNANRKDDSQPVAVPAVAGLELGFYVYLANFLHVIGLQTVPSDRAGFLFQCTYYQYSKRILFTFGF
jgi:hypothetical protein